jgi:hypothetical protein
MLSFRQLLSGDLLAERHAERPVKGARMLYRPGDPITAAISPVNGRTRRPYA